MNGARPPLSPDKWKRARVIYEKALDEPVEQRLAVAISLCAGDRQLESEVNLWLAATVPAVPSTPYVGAPQTREELSPGSVLIARFKIVRFLNRGGMGEVYEAWDSDLREVVALKTIRPEMASEASMVEYLKEEVRQARQIGNPNVCRVYDVYCHGEAPVDRIWFLTMQLLEGRTLSEHLRGQGPFSTKEALELIGQMIAGLAAAHEIGVVHRDFKSSNIMLVQGPGGAKRAVITDFGLATRTTTTEPWLSGQRQEGTPAYVAPEQWYDGIAGPSADQYSLGVVICEMITGVRPTPSRFEGSQLLPPELPKNLGLGERWEAVIRRCLEVRPEDRFNSVTEILPALDPGRRQKTLLRWLVALIILPTMAAATVLLVVRAHRLPRISELVQLTPAMSLSADPSLSRDGKIIAYTSDQGESGNLDIWVQQLPDGTPTRITTDPMTDDVPSLSPDGRTVAFRSDRDHGGIYVADVARGAERLVSSGGHDPKFSPDGRSILYWTGDDNEVVASGRIYRLDLARGQPIQLAVGFADARKPLWSPDGRYILFKGCPSGSGSIPVCWDWWVTNPNGEIPQNTGAKAILDERHIRPLGEFGGWYGDTVLFSAARGREVHLWELSLSPKDSHVKGEPRELTPGDAREEITSSSLADNNVIAFTDLSTAFHIWRIDNATNPEHARAYRVTLDADLDIGPYISHNGRWLSFARGLAPDRGIWVRNAASGKETLFPATGFNKYAPVIDDDGSTLAYEAWEKGVPAIFIAKRGSKPVRFCTACWTPTGWFDGKTALFYGDASSSYVDMYFLETGQSHTVLSQPGARVAEATWSPENEFVLFTVSSEHVFGQVYAARFPRGTRSPNIHWTAITSSSESSEKPRWSGDGKTVFYLSNRDNSWCVWGQHFDPRVGLPVGKPFAVQHYHNPKLSPYAISSHSFNLSTAGDALYLNLAEMSGTVWTGKLERRKYSSFRDVFRH